MRKFEPRNIRLHSVKVDVNNEISAVKKADGIFDDLLRDSEARRETPVSALQKIKVDLRDFTSDISAISYAVINCVIRAYARLSVVLGRILFTW